MFVSAETEGDTPNRTITRNTAQDEGGAAHLPSAVAALQPGATMSLHCGILAHYLLPPVQHRSWPTPRHHHSGLYDARHDRQARQLGRAVQGAGLRRQSAQAWVRTSLPCRQLSLQLSGRCPAGNSCPTQLHNTAGAQSRGMAVTGACLQCCCSAQRAGSSCHNADARLRDCIHVGWALRMVKPTSRHISHHHSPISWQRPQTNPPVPAPLHRGG